MDIVCNLVPPRFLSATPLFKTQYVYMHSLVRLQPLFDYPFQLVVIEPLPADLFTSPVTNCLDIRERWRTKSKTKLHLCVIIMYTIYDICKLDAQWRSCLQLFWRKDATVVFLLPAHGPGKKISGLRRAQNPIQSDGTYTCRSNTTINRII